MLQSELKVELKKTQLRNKILFIITGILFLSIIVLSIFFFTNDNKAVNSSDNITQSETNKTPALQVSQREIDTAGVNANDLSKLELISKLDSMSYIIDTLQLSLLKAEAKSRRDLERYAIASNYVPPAEIIKEYTIVPAPEKETVPVPVKKVEKVEKAKEQDNVKNLIETAKKFAKTDCKKALDILYSAKKIAKVEGTLKANNSTINKMMQDCLKQMDEN